MSMLGDISIDDPFEPPTGRPRGHGGEGEGEPASRRLARVSNEQLPSAAKALVLLEVFVGAPPSLGVTEIARAAGITKSTAFRLLGVLSDFGFVHRHGSRYSLGDRLFELGSHTAHSRPRSIRDVATPHLLDLYTKYHSTIHLAVLDGAEVVYLEKLYGRSHPSGPSHVGSRLPATLTAVGKASLAFAGPKAIAAVLENRLERRTCYSLTEPSRLIEELGEVRRTGYAVDREESSIGVNCFAAPIFVGERLVASVSICTASTNASEQLVAAVKGAASAIGRATPRSSVEFIGSMRSASA